MATVAASNDDPPSLLDKLAPASLARFDCFPKLPTTYRSRSGSRGLVTVLVLLAAALLVLNDVGEYAWGWPDYEFSVDRNESPNLEINLDMIVNMPCSFISVDLRDAMGDRLFLSGSLRREATFFDVGQATLLKEHSEALSVSQAVAQSRKSRGLFAWLLSSNSKPTFKPRYDHRSEGKACRITGSLTVKRVTANLHITTIGHGYASYEHVDHNKMNLSHIITEFSFGPFFPEIVQPLDNSFESTDKHFIAYQYYLHVVPTTYIPARSLLSPSSSSATLNTAQYSVTHYTHDVARDHQEAGTPPPGIFFKFDLDPLALTIHQRTTTLVQLLIRCVGVLGGTFVCAGYAMRAAGKAVEVVTGDGRGGEIVTAESTAVRGGGLRAKWTGGELRSRVKMANNSGGGRPGSPYGAPPYMGAGTPPPPGSATMSPHMPYSPTLNSTLVPPPPRFAAPGQTSFLRPVSPGPPATFAGRTGGSPLVSNVPLPASRSPSPLPGTVTAAFEDPAGGGSGSLGPYDYFYQGSDDSARKRGAGTGAGGGEC